MQKTLQGVDFTGSASGASRNVQSTLLQNWLMCHRTLLLTYPIDYIFAEKTLRDGFFGRVCGQGVHLAHYATSRPLYCRTDWCVTENCSWHALMTISMQKKIPGGSLCMGVLLACERRMFSAWRECFYCACETHSEWFSLNVKSTPECWKMNAF